MPSSGWPGKSLWLCDHRSQAPLRVVLPPCGARRAGSAPHPCAGELRRATAPQARRRQGTHLAVPPRGPDATARLGRPTPVRPMVLTTLQEAVRGVEPSAMLYAAVRFCPLTLYPSCKGFAPPDPPKKSASGLPKFAKSSIWNQKIIKNSNSGPNINQKSKFPLQNHHKIQNLMKYSAPARNDPLDWGA